MEGLCQGHRAQNRCDDHSAKPRRTQNVMAARAEEPADPNLEISDEAHGRRRIWMAGATQLHEDIGHPRTVAARVRSLRVGRHLRGYLQAPMKDLRDSGKMKSEDGFGDELAKRVTSLQVRALVRKNDALHVLGHRKKSSRREERRTKQAKHEGLRLRAREHANSVCAGSRSFRQGADRAHGTQQASRGAT
jgi:hypothetical protein